MAEEAFALSPISARGALPSETDYEAIREAFLETARGRWFLTEYSKRNRTADTNEVLHAVARIEATLAATRSSAASLIDAMSGIRAAVRAAKVSAAEAMPRPGAADTDGKLVAARESVQTISKISMTMRECGADSRICNLLDAQVKVLAADQQIDSAAESRKAVLAAFDVLIQRIERLASSSPTADSGSGAAVHANSADAPAPMTASPIHVVAPTAEKPVSSVTPLFPAAHETALEMASTIDHDAVVVLTSTPTAAPQIETQQTQTQRVEMPATGTTAPEAVFTEAIPTEAFAVEAPLVEASVFVAPIAEVPVVEAILAEAPVAEATSAEVPVTESSANELSPTVASAIETAAMEAESVVAESIAMESMVAEDMAMLDLVAAEMGAPEIVPEPEPAVETPAPDPAQAIVAAQVYAPATSAAPPAIVAAPAAAGSTPAAFARAASVYKAEMKPERDAVSLPRQQSPAETSPVEKPRESQRDSLGAALIAGGVIPNPSRPPADPLAPIRRMSQNEKIAFFS